MIAGRKQQATMKAAAIHLNMIFRTDPNGISKSTTETRCDKMTDGGGGGVARTVEGAGRCAPYFSIGRQSSIDVHSPATTGLHRVLRSIPPSGNIRAVCVSTYE